ncbi:MAG: hypothetical protein IPP13_22980 [Kouleothrix sp.]|nr:hypothetical protein [Kouleothrix sp.]
MSEMPNFRLAPPPAHPIIPWDRVADWVARQDRPFPPYHRLCLRIWLWAFRRSL